MTQVALENLAPGMRLNKPVLNLQGMLLLKAGEVLTEKHLAIFRTWGIREADVVREDDARPEEIVQAILPPETLEAVRTETAHRFRRAQPTVDPVMAEILRIAISRLIRRRASSTPMRQMLGRPEDKGRGAGQVATPGAASLEGPGVQQTGGQTGKGGA